MDARLLLNDSAFVRADAVETTAISLCTMAIHDVTLRLPKNFKQSETKIHINGSCEPVPCGRTGLLCDSVSYVTDRAITRKRGENDKAPVDGIAPTAFPCSARAQASISLVDRVNHFYV